LGRLRKRILGISVEEASFARRGFRGGDASTRRHLEQVGRTFLHGYHAALEEDRPDRLASRLDELAPELRGFAFEGAGMALYLLDLLTPWNRGRLGDFLAGPGAAHTYMVHVGAGWALAQLRRRVEPALARLDPLLGWLAVDGYGFHHGYFGWKVAVERRRVPKRLSGSALKVFDQGLGRSLWFVEGAEVARIAATIAGFGRERQADLWSGVGLACAYAGGVSEQDVGGMSRMAGPYRPHLAQGVAFAAKARQRADNPAPHTDLACRVLCGMPAEEAAGLTDRALAGLAGEDGLPAYEVWRGRIRANWTREAVTS
jgi:enediyne biosynthesis protein E3